LSEFRVPRIRVHILVLAAGYQIGRFLYGSDSIAVSSFFLLFTLNYFGFVQYSSGSRYSAMAQLQREARREKSECVSARPPVLAESENLNSIVDYLLTRSQLAPRRTGDEYY
jgi:hypothetical protein